MLVCLTLFCSRCVFFLRIFFICLGSIHVRKRHQAHTGRQAPKKFQDNKQTAKWKREKKRRERHAETKTRHVIKNKYSYSLFRLCVFSSLSLSLCVLSSYHGRFFSSSSTAACAIRFVCVPRRLHVLFGNDENIRLFSSFDGDTHTHGVRVKKHGKRQNSRLAKNTHHKWDWIAHSLNLKRIIIYAKNLLNSRKLFRFLYEFHISVSIFLSVLSCCVNAKIGSILECLFQFFGHFDTQTEKEIMWLEMFCLNERTKEHTHRTSYWALRGVKTCDSEITALRSIQTRIIAFYRVIISSPAEERERESDLQTYSITMIQITSQQKVNHSVDIVFHRHDCCWLFLFFGAVCLLPVFLTNHHVVFRWEYSCTNDGFRSLLVILWNPYSPCVIWHPTLPVV